jgi:hypothetical protein
VIPCHENWAQARVHATQLSEFVAFVDDDDIIAPAALSICLKALHQTGAGLAFTNEVSIDLSGKELYATRGTRRYGGIGIHPRTAHHLCVLRREFVDPRALELHNKFGMGVDWFIKASAALQGGAIHVPIDGYFWTQHDDTMTRAAAPIFGTLIREMGHSIRATWRRADGEIPKFEM